MIRMPPPLAFIVPMLMFLIWDIHENIQEEKRMYPALGALRQASFLLLIVGASSALLTMEAYFVQSGLPPVTSMLLSWIELIHVIKMLIQDLLSSFVNLIISTRQFLEYVERICYQVLGEMMVLMEQPFSPIMNVFRGEERARRAIEQVQQGAENAQGNRAVRAPIHFQSIAVDNV